MSHYDYMYGMEQEAKDAPFYGLIQAAMRRADTKNLEKLKEAWPHVWEELLERYYSDNGLLKSEKYGTFDFGGEKEE